MFDYEPFWQRYETGAWEPETRAWVSELNPGDLFVDVGAWIGPVSLWAVERGAYVLAVEPDPVACAELRRVLRPSIDGGFAEVWEGALVADAGEEAYLAPNPNAGGELGDSMSVLAPELTTSIPVPAFTLDAVLQGRTPNLVKIDVEGYETRLAPAILPWLASVGAHVQVSIHGEQLWDETSAEEPQIGTWGSATFQPDVRWGDWRLDP